MGKCDDFVLRTWSIALAAAFCAVSASAALTVSEREDGSFSVLRDGKVLVESAAFHCASPKPARIEKSFETAPDGAKVWNRWSEEREGRFRMEVVERPDGAVEMSVFGETDGWATNRLRGLRLEIPVRVLKGRRWRALTGNGRKHIPEEGVFDAGFRPIAARWMETDGILWDFNALGPSTYAHATTFDSVNGVWHVLPPKGGRYVLSGGASLGRATVGGHGGTKIVIREGTFDDYSKHHFLSFFRYSQRLPVGRLVSFGAPKAGDDYVPGDRAFEAAQDFGWVGDPARRTIVGHRSGAYYSHVAGKGAATYRFAGLPSGFYVATVQLGNWTGTENAFSVSVNGEALAADIALEKGRARTISRAVHVADGKVDFTFDGEWLVSAIGVQPLLADSEDFTVRRGFWYVKGYEPSVRYRSEDYGRPLAAATADETIAMPAPGEEASAPRRDPPMPVELPDADAPALAWTRDARLWRFMSNNASLFEFADDAAREKYVAEQSKGKGCNAVMISGMLSRHTFPERLLNGGQAEVGKFVETFHRHGMKVIDHIDLTLLWNDDIGFRLLMERLPEVLKDKYDNLPAVQLCMNNAAFKRKVFEYLRRDIELGVDGFQLDEGEFWAHGCACKTCRETFTREAGWQFPLDETDPSVTGLETPLARRWHEWRCKTITNWYVELRRYLKDLKPDLLLSVYTTHWGFTSSHPERGASSDLIDLGRVHNFFGTEVMTRNVMQSSRPLMPLRKMKNILTLAYGMPVWGWYYTSNEKASYFAWAVANMCGQSSLLTDHLPEPDVPRFEVWGAGPANMRKGSVSVAEAAVLFSGYSRDWNRDVDFIPDAMGLAQELEALHVPYEFIGDMSVDVRHLAKYKVLFVGTAQCLSDAEIAAIKAFAAKGGRVYMAETAGTRDEIGEPRAEPAFAAALRNPKSNIALMPSAAPFCANEVSPPRVWSFDPDLAAEAAFRAKLAEMVKGATVWTVRGAPDKVYTALWREKDGTLAIHFLNSTGTNIKPGEAMTPAAPDPAFPALAEDIVFTLPVAEGSTVTAASPDFDGERSLAVVRNGDGTATVTLPRELLKAYTVVKISGSKDR